MTAKQGPSFDELRRRAAALIPILRQRAAEAEALRRIPDATIEDLHSSGLFRMLQPASVGGSELPFRAIYELCALVGRGCGSTAWVLGNLASHHWMLAMWPTRAQDEVWEASPDHLIGSALIFPCGRARKVPEGYRLRGRWPFSSGIDPSAWNMIGAVVHDEEIDLSENRIFLLPRGDYRVIDTWHVTGLRGTGSKDVEVDDILVPAYRSLGTDAMREATHPGRERHKGALFRLPALSLFPFVIGGTLAGIAQGAIEQFVEATRTKISNYTGKGLADFATLQERIAEAAAHVDAAVAVCLRDCDEATRIVEEGGMPTVEQRARYRRDGAFAAKLCTDAVDLIFTGAGGTAIYEQNPLQRAFRDIHAANAHYMLSWDVNLPLYGRVVLGLSPDTAL